MSSIRINEVDNTTYRNPTIINRNTVLVAGRASKVSTDATDLPVVGKPILCDTLVEFYANFGRQLGKTSTTNSIEVPVDQVDKTEVIVSQSYNQIRSLYIDIDEIGGSLKKYRAIYKSYLLDNTGNGTLYVTERISEGVYRYSNDFKVTVTPGVDQITLNIIAPTIDGVQRVFNFTSGEYTFVTDSEVYGKNRYGYDYAVNLLTAGLSVLYVPYYVYGISDNELDEMNTTDIETIFDIVFSPDNVAFYQDDLLCDVKFIPTIYPYSNAQVSLIREIVQSRKDCIIFVDPYNVSGSTAVIGSADASSENYIPNLPVVNNITGDSYSVVVGPAAKVELDVGESSDDKLLVMQPSFWVLRTIGEGIKRGLPIYSIWANSPNGLINGIKEYTSIVTSQVMADWTGTIENPKCKQVIPLMYIPSVGDVIYGNNTRLNVNSDTRSSLDSFNVRLAANEVKREIKRICRGLVFNTNDSILWDNFKTQVESFLDMMVKSGAVYDYDVTMDETTVSAEDIDRLTVPGIVSVSFARAAEFFDITFNLTPTGAVFTE